MTDTTIHSSIDEAHATRRKGVWYALGAFLAWGAVPVYWKQVIEVPAGEILAHRVVWTTVLTTVLIARAGKLGELWAAVIDPRNIRPFMGSSALIGANWGLYIWAVNSGHVLESSIGYFINPLISVVFGVIILGERLRRWQIMAIGLALAGVLYLTISLRTIPWIALTLAMTFATYGLIRKTSRIDSLLGLGLESLWGVPFALGYLVYRESQGLGAFSHLGLSTDLYLMGSGIITAVPLLWFSGAVRRLPLSMIGILQYIAPSCQFMCAVFIYKETFGPSHFLSFGLIWLALAVYAGEAVLGRKRAPI